MKFITANIWGGRLEPQILNFFETEQPDIVCLQEVIEIEGGRSFMFASLDEIQKAIGAEHSYMSAVFTFKYMNREASFGNCIISKYPITRKKTIFTARHHIDNFDIVEEGSANMRNLQLADIELPGGEILHVLNHHGHHNHQHKDGDEETMRQCGIIADEIKKLGGKIILGGDFNLVPHSESLNQINKLMKNWSIVSGLKTTRTVLTHKTEVCDYIFTGSGIESGNFECHDEIISDHKALVLEFN